MNGFLLQGTYSSGTYLPFFSVRAHIVGVDDAVALVVMVVVPPPSLRGKGDDDHGKSCIEAAAEAEEAVPKSRSAALERLILTSPAS